MYMEGVPRARTSGRKTCVLSNERSFINMENEPTPNPSTTSNVAGQGCPVRHWAQHRDKATDYQLTTQQKLTSSSYCGYGVF